MTKENYFDNASTKLISPLVANAMSWYLNLPTLQVNPSAGIESETINEIISDCKMKLCKLVNCKPCEIIFTSGASESNALALQVGFNCSNKSHKDILYNPKACYLNEDDNVVIENKHENSINNVCTLINNETGEINEIHPNMYHCDATQALGHISIDFDNSQFRTMTLSGHKIGADKSIGVLLVKESYLPKIKPLIYGTQNNGLRGGTYNSLGILSLKIALELLNDYQEENIHTINKVKDAFLSEFINDNHFEYVDFGTHIIH